MPDPTTPPPPDRPVFATARREALEDAADLARLAPSIHNTQPWILVLADDRLALRMSLRADRSRQLPAIDPCGRALVISVGAALLNARAGLAASGWAADVTRLPRPEDPDLLAEIRPVPGRPDDDLAGLAQVIRRRRTNRRRFTPDQLPDDVLQELTELCAGEDTRLIPVLRPEDRTLVAGLTQEADRIQTADPAYRAELREWTTRKRGAGDGVPPSAVPRAEGRQRGALPIRDFDTQGAGALPADTASGTEQTLLLLVTTSDEPLAWLRAGETVERLLLELTRQGWAASPVTQAIEVPTTRARLRSALTGGAHPQMLLRTGHAAATTATPRRRRGEVVRNSSRSGGPVRVQGQPEPPDEAPTAPHPVSDGRGGTIWTR